MRGAVASGMADVTTIDGVCYLSPEMAANELGITVSTLRRRASDLELSPIRAQRALWYSQPQLEQLRDPAIPLRRKRREST